MKTKRNSPTRATCLSFSGIICAGAIILITSDAQAQSLFEADNGAIYEFTPGGMQSTFASGLSSIPGGLAFNSAGDLFEEDTTSGNIYEYTPEGGQTIFASGLGNGGGNDGLAFNSAGDLFAADDASGNIYEYTPGGVRTTFASGLNGPNGLAFDSAGDLFEADDGSGNIYEFTPSGVRTTFASGLYKPVGLAFNSAGDLFETDWGTGNIYEFTPSGVRTTFASGLGFPQGLAFNNTGDLFAADNVSGNIYEYTPSGARSAFASGLPDLSVGLAFQGIILPGSSPHEFYPAVVNAVGISTNQAGTLVYQWFNNGNIISMVGSEQSITNLTGLSLVYDQTANALDVVSGTNNTNYSVISVVMTFSGGASLPNTNGTEIQLLNGIYLESSQEIAGTLLARELIPPTFKGRKAQPNGFSLQGQLQFVAPLNGTNSPVIYTGSISAGAGSRSGF